jgi:phosphatidylserine decarboxylase
MLIAFYVLLGLALLFLGGVWFLRNVWFHRDPDHTKTAQNDGEVRSPVYGRVSYIRQIRDGVVVSEKLGEPIPIKDITKTDWPTEAADGNGTLIGIAMTAVDVHFQYSPLAGEMGEIRHYQTGMNLPMFDFWEYVKITYFRRAIQLFARRYTLENERQTMWIAGRRAKVGMVLIADKFIDKITTFTKTGESVASGGKLSFIGRGSQVDLVVCGHPDLEVLVHEGQAVHGPLTVVARLKDSR